MSVRAPNDGCSLMCRVFTMSENAQELRKSRRWLQSRLSLHPADTTGNPHYAPLGRTKTFDENAIPLHPIGGRVGCLTAACGLHFAGQFATS